MTLNEFKAWFDGFTELMDRPPSAKQWARTQERVKEIDDQPVTERVFIERYWPRYPRPWALDVTPMLYSAQQTNTQAHREQRVGYNSLAAMSALGRIEHVAA